jgi:hypothetical protein
MYVRVCVCVCKVTNNNSPRLMLELFF